MECIITTLNNIFQKFAQITGSGISASANWSLNMGRLTRPGASPSRGMTSRPAINHSRNTANFRRERELFQSPVHQRYRPPGAGALKARGIRINSNLLRNHRDDATQSRPIDLPARPRARPRARPPGHGGTAGPASSDVPIPNWKSCHVLIKRGHNTLTRQCRPAAVTSDRGAELPRSRWGGTRPTRPAYTRAAAAVTS